MANPKTRIDITAKDLTKSAFKSATANMKKLTGAVFSTKTALVGLAGAAGFGAVIAANLKTIDILGKTSDKLGITTEALGKLQFAASIAGTSNNTLTKALQKMSVGIGEASFGIGQARMALDRLGINFQDLIKLAPDQQFARITGSMAKLEDQTTRLTLAYELFGGRGTDLVNIMMLGEDGINALGAEAEMLGLTLSRETVAGVENTNDSITRLLGVFKGFGLQMTATLAPAIQALSDEFKEFLIDLAASEGGVKKFSQNFAISLLEAIQSGVEGFGEFMKFVERARLALIDFGIVERSEKDKRISSTKREIETLSEAVKWYDSRNIVRRPDIVRDLATAEAQLAKDMGAQVTTGEKIISTLQRIIDKTKERQAADQAGGGTPNNPPPPSAGDFVGPQLAEPVQTTIDRLKLQTDALGLSLLTEEDMLIESFSRRSQIVIDAADRDIITADRKAQILMGLSKKLADDEDKIKEKQAASEKALRIASLKNASGILNSLTTLVGSSSKKQFEIGKKLAKAAVVIDTAAGIMKVIGQGGFAGIAAAVGVAIAGVAQLAQINRTQFGGGGGISAGGVSFPSPTAGNPPASVAPSSPLDTPIGQQSQISITIQGNVIGNEEFVNDVLVPILIEEINNNDTVLINGNSAQALELAS